MTYHRLFMIVLLLMVTLTAGFALQASSADQSDDDYIVLEFDVSEKGSRFSIDDTPVFDDGQPAYGAEFITEGYLYPAGTLDGTNGTLENGDPEFPDLVLGTWFCRGWLIGDGFHTQTGLGQITTQIFDFGDSVGRTTIVTDGFELVDLHTPISRAISGGTGEYADVGGEQVQEVLGYSPYGINLRVTLLIRNTVAD